MDEITRQAIGAIVDQELDRLELAATDPAADPEDMRLGAKLLELRRQNHPGRVIDRDEAMRVANRRPR